MEESARLLNEFFVGASAGADVAQGRRSLVTLEEEFERSVC